MIPKYVTVIPCRSTKLLVPGVRLRREAAWSAGGEGLFRNQRRQRDGYPRPELRPGAAGAGGCLLRRRVRGGGAQGRGQRVGHGPGGLRDPPAPERGLFPYGEHGNDGAGGGETRLPRVRHRRRDGHQGGRRGGGGRLRGRVEALRWIVRRRFSGVMISTRWKEDGNAARGQERRHLRRWRKSG